MLVEVHQLRFDGRQLFDPLLLELGQAGIGLAQKVLRLGHSGIGLVTFRRPQVALDLQGSQLVQQRSRGARQPVGFLLQRTDAFIDTARVGIGYRNLRR